MAPRPRAHISRSGGRRPRLRAGDGWRAVQLRRHDRSPGLLLGHEYPGPGWASAPMSDRSPASRATTSTSAARRPCLWPVRPRVSGVDAGGNHTCGVTVEDAAYCWGINTDGELGARTHSGPELCADSVACSTKPVAVAGRLAFAVVSGGLSHTCGVTQGGAAWCWGTNLAGERGSGLERAGALLTGPLQHPAARSARRLDVPRRVGRRALHLRRHGRRRGLIPPGHQ